MLDRRRHMFQHFGRNYEVVPSKFAGVGLHHVQIRSLMIKRVGIVELLPKSGSERILIAHASPSQAFDDRELRQYKLDPENFTRQERHQASHAHRRSAFLTAWIFPAERRVRAVTE